jgi:putative peptidoglycan lipid II flippase
MFRRFLNSRSKTIFSAAFVLAAAALASRILGLFRDRLLAGRFGAGDELDIYYAAFRLPDLVFSVLILGAISSAFIPIFAQYFHKDKKEAWQLVSGVLNLAFLSLIVVAGILAIFAPQIISLIAPGFSGAKQEMTILLTRIMFLSPIILGISSIFSGVLQYFHRFLVYSLAPIMYNIGIILGILIFVPALGLVGLAWGVVLGVFLHMLIQLPSVIYSGFSWRPILDIYNKGVRKIIKLMIPRTIGLAGFQINFLVITAIASTLASGSIAIFNLSNNLQYVPIGIFGIAFTTAVFPNLARAFARKRKKTFSKDFSLIFSQILFLIIPLSALFFILRAQIVRVILGTGEFGWVDTRLTAAALGIFSLSIFAQGLIPLVGRAFYAFQNTRTPVLISLVSIILNICFSFLFIWILGGSNVFSSLLSSILKLKGIKEFAILGLPLAFSLASIINFAVLLKLFARKINWWHPQYILKSFSKIILATLLMGIVTYSFLYILDLFLDTHTFIGIFLQGVLAAIAGIVVYCLAMILLKSSEILTIKQAILKIIFRK